MATEVGSEVTVGYLRDFADAWNRHNIDDLMSFMTDDCVFQFSTGPDVDGTRHDGREKVREAYQLVLSTFPDGRWGNDSHFVAGDRGLSEWTFTATGRDGKPIEVRGCDIFTFRDGKILVKNSFRKNRVTS